MISTAEFSAPSERSGMLSDPPETLEADAGIRKAAAPEKGIGRRAAYPITDVMSH